MSAMQELIAEAIDRFNNVYQTDISLVNTHIAFFTPETGESVRNAFITTHFPDNHHFEQVDYYSYVAEAFVGQEYGIMIRSDLDLSRSQWLEILLHEIGHLFCTRNEIPGGNFFAKFCMGQGEHDGYMNAGYAIWREFIADFVSNCALPTPSKNYLRAAKWNILRIYKQVDYRFPEAKLSMSLVLKDVFLSSEICNAKNWFEAEKAINRENLFGNQYMMNILKSLFDNLHSGKPWEITEEFIEQLGSQYLTYLAYKAVNG